MKPRFVPLDPFLLRQIVPRDGDDWIMRQFDAPELVATVTAPGTCWAMIDGGLVIGAGGLVPQWAARAQGWLLISRFATPRHVVAAVRFARPWLDRLQGASGYRRIDATTLAAPGHCRLLERLGFRREGLLEAYGPDGRDYAVFGRVAWR